MNANRKFNFLFAQCLTNVLTIDILYLHFRSFLGPKESTKEKTNLAHFLAKHTTHMISTFVYKFHAHQLTIDYEISLDAFAQSQLCASQKHTHTFVPLRSGFVNCIQMNFRLSAVFWHRMKHYGMKWVQTWFDLPTPRSVRN